MKPVHAFLDFNQRLIARSRLLVRLAILVRNQCRCVIKYHLAESPDVSETGEVWLRALLAPHCTSFVDVGANVGDWLGSIVSEKGQTPFRALAFEPSSSAFQALSARFGSDPRVELINLALGDAPGESTFFEEDAAGKGSTMLSQFSRSAGVNRTVTITTLEHELAARGWSGIDFLKIDAEGYDLRVLEGGSSLLRDQHIGIVQFEYNRGWQLAGDTLFGALTLLQSFGYDVYVLKRDGLYTLNYTLYEEYFEYTNFVAVSAPYAAIVKERLRGTI